MSNPPPIVGSMTPVTRAEFEQVCSGFVTMNRQLLNTLAGVAAAVEELRNQIDGLGIVDGGTFEATLERLPASEVLHKLRYQLMQLEQIAKGRDPSSRAQRRHPKKN